MYNANTHNNHTVYKYVICMDILFYAYFFTSATSIL